MNISRHGVCIHNLSVQSNHCIEIKNIKQKQECNSTKACVMSILPSYRNKSNINYKKEYTEVVLQTWTMSYQVLVVVQNCKRYHVCWLPHTDTSRYVFQHWRSKIKGHQLLQFTTLMWKSFLPWSSANVSC